MIVDCHTQILDARGGVGPALFESTPFESSPVDRAIVLGFKSRFLATEVPNRDLADYVRRHPSKLVGFAGIDPCDPTCLEELAAAQEELNLKGVVVSPALQDFHPSDTRACQVYEACAGRGMPVVFDLGHRNPAARMEFAKPVLLDQVASEFPRLRMVVTHMGYPWVHETISLLGKHANVFADVAGLLPKRWLTYNALASAYEYGVIDKLLFGSDFPHRSPAACIEALYSVNQMVQGTNLPVIPREQLRGIVERDALVLLGVEAARNADARPRSSAMIDDE